MGYDESLENIEYSVQGRRYKLIDYLAHKPNIGTSKHLLSNSEIYKAYRGCFDDYRKYKNLFMLLTYKLKDAIAIVQGIRNEAAHGGSISRAECQEIRNLILGIGQESIMIDMLRSSRLIS